MRRAVLGWSVCVVVVLAAIGPLVLVVATGLTSPLRFTSSGPSLTGPWSLASLRAVLQVPSTLLGPIMTTSAVAVVVVAGQTTSTLLAAYAVVRLPFPGRGTALAASVATYLVPPIVTIVPTYFVIVRIGLAGTFAALVLPSLLASPFALLLLRQWIAGLPSALFDAAELDGAGHLAVLRRIVVPLSWPAIGSVVLAIVVSSWNAYLWPRLIAGTRLPQVQVAIDALRTQYQDNWTLVMAATSISLVPPAIAAILLGRGALARADGEPGS